LWESGVIASTSPKGTSFFEHPDLHERVLISLELGQYLSHTSLKGSKRYLSPEFRRNTPAKLEPLKALQRLDNSAINQIEVSQAYLP